MKEKRPAPKILKLAFLAFSVYAVFTLMSLNMQITSIQKQIKTLETEKAKQQSTNEEMKKNLEEGLDDEYLANIAREKLGYVSEGERVFVDTSSK